MLIAEISDVIEFRHPDYGAFMMPKTGHVERIRRIRNEIRQNDLDNKRTSGCHGCGGSWVRSPGPMLRKEIWSKVGRSITEILCERCVCARLGRPITQRDLMDVPFNDRWVNRRRSKLP